MRLSLGQFDVSRANLQGNLEKIAELAQEAAAQESDLLCLPEMCTTGFDWDYNREHLSDTHSQMASLSQIAKDRGLAICGSFLEETESGNAANCFCYFDSNGVIRARYRKLHLFTLFHEERHVEPGEACVTFDADHGVMGASICYDLRFPELYRRNTKEGAWLHFLPAAFPHPRLEHWRTLIRARAIENQSFMVAVNQCGCEGHEGSVGSTQYFGHSIVVDPWGEIIAEAGEDETMLHVELDPSLAEQVRSKLTALDDRRVDLFDY